MTNLEILTGTPASIQFLMYAHHASHSGGGMVESILRSIMRGFGWEIGRDLAHEVVNFAGIGTVGAAVLGSAGWLYVRNRRGTRTRGRK